MTDEPREAASEGLQAQSNEANTPTPGAPSDTPSNAGAPPSNAGAPPSSPQWNPAPPAAGAPPAYAWKAGPALDSAPTIPVEIARVRSGARSPLRWGIALLVVALVAGTASA